MVVQRGAEPEVFHISVVVATTDLLTFCRPSNQKSKWECWLQMLSEVCIVHAVKFFGFFCLFFFEGEAVGYCFLIQSAF